MTSGGSEPASSAGGHRQRGHFALAPAAVSGNYEQQLQLGQAQLAQMQLAAASGGSGHSAAATKTRAGIKHRQECGGSSQQQESSSQPVASSESPSANTSGSSSADWLHIKSATTLSAQNMGAIETARQQLMKQQQRQEQRQNTRELTERCDLVFNRLMALEAFRKLHPSLIRSLCSYAFVERIDKGVIGKWKW